MIDQQLIDRSTDVAKLSLTTCKSTASSDLHLLNDFLDKELVAKLKQYLNQDSNDKWYLGELFDRDGLAWDADTVIEELHMVFDNLTTVISEQFFDRPLNFIGTHIWRDRSPFSQKWHSDNPMINVAIQLYLFDEAPSECGTSFMINGIELAVPYIHNSGYILTTHTPPGIIHKPSIVLPPGAIRHSIYGIWSLAKKKIEKETTC